MHTHLRPFKSAALVATAGSLLVVTACGSDGSGATAKRPGDDAFFSVQAATQDGWKAPTDKCPDSAAVNAPIKGTVTIGATGPLTGGVAAGFTPYFDGYRAYIDYANKWGLLDALKVKLIVEDDQLSPDLTPNAVNKLIESKVDVFAGSLGTASNQVVRTTLNDECMPQLFASTGAPDMNDPKAYPWTSGLPIPYDLEVKAYARKIAADHPSGAKVALLTVANPAGKAYVNAMRSVASGLGIKITSEQTLDPVDTNPPTSQVTNLAADKPDAIVALPVGSGCVTFLRELAAREAQADGWNPDVYLTWTCANSTVLRAAKDAADGVMTANMLADIQSDGARSRPGVAAYLDWMDQEGKSKVAASALTGWYEGEVVVAVLKQAQQSPDGLTRASILEASRNFKLSSSVTLPRVEVGMNGTTDPVPSETFYITKYSADTGSFTLEGNLVSPSSS
ncbi:ABC transporter substrate-binding protein [Nonomuraea sp. NPDC026600]|uniref:ABC transporter substrate-binding protein n=1 Tax=Nonomuraea sp. NPDC026600 TaxID=3155363 RepID=UPI0033CE33A4